MCVAIELPDSRGPVAEHDSFGVHLIRPFDGYPRGTGVPRSAGPPRATETAIVHIVKYPHPTLRHRSKPLRRVDAELRRLVAEMFELMYAQKGVGLAANQVDLPYRLFIVNLASDPAAKQDELVFINPVITSSRGNALDDEGCLSFPDIFAPVRRPERCVISAYNLRGEEVRYELAGLAARAVQHEYDHLDGVLFIDRLDEDARVAVRPALAALEMEFESQRGRGAIPDDHQISRRLAELESLRA